MPTIDFDQLTDIEPGLAALERDILAVKRKRGKAFCANYVWYTLFKPRLLYLAGWEARKPELRTMLAYDVAYDHLYDLLPDCRRCACVSLAELY